MRSNFTSLEGFFQEIKRREAAKMDIIAGAPSLRMQKDEFLVAGPEGSVFDKSFDAAGQILPYAHGQLATKLNIPKQYYDRIGEVEGLRTYTVNRLLEHKGEPYMVRYLDGKARAILSDKFFPVDHQIILEGGVLGALARAGEIGKDVQIASHSLSDVKMYLQVVFPRFTGEVRVGDPVQFGVSITNSEVGAGAADVRKMVWRLVCKNGAVGDSIVRRNHVGSRIEQSDLDVQSIYRRETMIAELKSFRMRLEDSISAFLTEASFESELQKLRVAADQKIARPDVAIRNVTEHFQFTKEEYEDVMKQMGNAADWTRYGLYNAVTALAHRETVDVDRTFEYERAGQMVIDMPTADWRRLAEDVA